MPIFVVGVARRVRLCRYGTEEVKLSCCLLAMTRVVSMIPTPSSAAFELSLFSRKDLT